MFHILFYIIAAIAILFVAAIAGILIVHFTRYAINPAYRKKMDADADEIIKERKQKKQQKKQEKIEARLRRQRALNSMTTTERLLYEQNKELNRIHWYLTLRDLFAPPPPTITSPHPPSTINPPRAPLAPHSQRGALYYKNKVLSITPYLVTLNTSYLNHAFPLAL